MTEFKRLIRRVPIGTDAEEIHPASDKDPASAAQVKELLNAPERALAKLARGEAHGPLSQVARGQFAEEYVFRQFEAATINMIHAKESMSILVSGDTGLFQTLVLLEKLHSRGVQHMHLHFVDHVCFGRRESKDWLTDPPTDHSKSAVSTTVMEARLAELMHWFGSHVLRLSIYRQAHDFIATDTHVDVCLNVHVDYDRLGSYYRMQETKLRLGMPPGTLIVRFIAHALTLLNIDRRNTQVVVEEDLNISSYVEPVYELRECVDPRLRKHFLFATAALFASIVTILFARKSR